MRSKYVTHVDDATTGFFAGAEGRGGTQLRFLIDSSSTGGSGKFALMVNTLAPHTEDAAAVHSHDAEHGFFILRGHGRFMIAGEEFEAGPDDAVYVPANAPHLVSNPGDEEFTYVVIYAPAEPADDLRQRFAGRD